MIYVYAACAFGRNGGGVDTAGPFAYLERFGYNYSFVKHAW